MDKLDVRDNNFSFGIFSPRLSWQISCKVSANLNIASKQLLVNTLVLSLKQVKWKIASFDLYFSPIPTQPLICSVVLWCNLSFSRYFELVSSLKNHPIERGCFILVFLSKCCWGFHIQKQSVRSFKWRDNLPSRMNRYLEWVGEGWGVSTFFSEKGNYVWTILHSLHSLRWRRKSAVSRLPTNRPEFFNFFSFLPSTLWSMIDRPRGLMCEHIVYLCQQPEIGR